MEDAYKPKHNPWLIAVTVTLATIMEVLDTSIANVALPHIGGTFGATQDEATWVVTSYLVANAIVLPLGAYLGSIIGRKKFYMGCVVMFGVSSLLCGLAPSLPLLLFFRVLQGLGGGGLQPSEQSILADTFAPEKRGQAFALYGVAVITAPIIGPTLGGWITDNYNWRWIFFINIPIALLSLFLTHRLVEDTPQIEKEVQEAKQGGFRLDLIGFGLIALTFGSLEVVLDKGQEDDWFGSHFILLFSALAVVGLLAMVIWELRLTKTSQRPILDLRLFASRNFSTSFLMIFVLGFTLYASTILLPQLLQSLMGYTAELSGMAISTGGLATIMFMPIVVGLMSKMDARIVVMIGFALLCITLFHMTSIDLGMSFAYVAKLRFFQSIGLAFLFVPINTLIYTGIPPNKNRDVSGLSNLARNVGGSAGTAFFATTLARQQQRHQVYLASNLYATSPVFQQQVRAMTQALTVHFGSLTDAQRGALASLFKSLQAQAGILSYIDILQRLSIICGCMIPMALLLRRPQKNAPITH